MSTNLEARFPFGKAGRCLYYYAIAFSLFQIAIAIHLIDFPSQVVRAIHVGLLISLSLSLYAFKTPNAPKTQIFLLFFAAFLGMAVAGYQWIEYAPLLLRAGDLSQIDLVVGVILIGLVFLVCWIMIGPALPIIAGIFLAYSLFGEYLPSPLNHRGYDFSQVIDQLSFGTEGIYGIPIYVSSTYIFLFILFGGFMEQAGIIKLFTDISLGLVGHKQGGAAKVSVVSSALMGTISGSGVANVVTTGQFTIPLMKKFGYRSAFAGGVEATASMGGQIMPPVMGAVAFIMAETLGVDYTVIVKAAIVPACLYFFTAFWMVHLEASKHGLAGQPKHELPNALEAFKRNWHLLLPLLVLIYLLFVGYTPLFAGGFGMVLTIVMILTASFMLKLPNPFLRALIWVAMGIIASLIFNYPYALLLVVISLIGINLLKEGGRQCLIQCRDALAFGAHTALSVGVACAMVGVIIGSMTLTGAANNFGQFIVHVGDNNLLLSLILTMITCLILGMGIPTIPNYIITATIAGPALLELGVPLIISHMFVFYFGIMADLTPPVALACFAAAPIAKASGYKISMEAIKIAATGFVIPFIAVYSPALMLQSDDLFAIFFVIFKTILAIGLWGLAIIGYWHGKINIWLRIFSFLSALMLILAIPITDQIGLLMAGIALVLCWRSK